MIAPASPGVELEHVGHVEHDLVAAELEVADHVASLARPGGIEEEEVRARAAEEMVVPGPAGQMIAARAAEQRVVAAVAAQVVVAHAAIGPVVAATQADDVVAAEAEHEVVPGASEDLVGGGGAEPRQGQVGEHLFPPERSLR